MSWAIEDQILLFAGDSGDGICREALVDLMLYDDYDLLFTNQTIDKLLKEGRLLESSDGQLIDPEALPNAAKRIRFGLPLISFRD